jgi:hypothetical protein
MFVLVVLEEQLQVDLEDGLEQAHVGTLVQTDLVFPDVDNQDLAGGQGEQGTLALKVLVLSTFAAVGTLDIHDQDVVCHLDGTSFGLVALVLAHPDSLCGLAALRLGHDTKVGAEEVVEQGALSGALAAKDRDEVVIEALAQDMFGIEVCG